jgi:hypothetical protein
MTRDARLSALHRGGFSPGAALSSPSAPAAIQRRAFAFRIRAASSSQPGRSAWRAGVPGLPGQAVTSRPPQDATPRSAFRIASGDAPHERGCECSSMNARCSQECSWDVVKKTGGLAPVSGREFSIPVLVQPHPRFELSGNRFDIRGEAAITGNLRWHSVPGSPCDVALHSSWLPSVMVNAWRSATCAFASGPAGVWSL